MSNLEKQGIIESVDGPTTPWVSPLIVTQKNDNIRTCVEINQAIKRERHSILASYTLNGAKIRSPLRLSSAHSCS